MIEQMIAVLGSKSLGLELTDKEIADIFWLAVQMRRRSETFSMSQPPETFSMSQPQQIQPSLSKLPAIPSQTSSKQNKDSQQSSSSTDPSINVYPRLSPDNHQSSTESSSSGLPIKISAAKALRNQLEIARSLKPLKRRVPSHIESIIDEAATVQRIAEEKLWIPVMRPAPERWFELALVIDEGASMMLWKQTIKEFQQLLERHGAFRDVKTWGLFTDECGEVLLRSRATSVARQQRFHSPKELIAPNGKRLFLVISDCVSSAWRSGAITKTLAQWASNGSITIIQVLPEWLWERSALGLAESVLLRSLAPGVPNQKLEMTALDLLDDGDVADKLKVPVVTLEPQSLSTWARMVAGAGDAQTKGFLLTPNSAISHVSSESKENSIASLSAKQRLQRFRLSASPMARRLAGLLAAVPINLPVVRLIQQTTLRESTQVHIAEVFLGGILKPLLPIYPDTNPDEVQYDFIDGVRDLLLDSVPLNDLNEVLSNISKYVAQRAGLSIDQFTAILANPMTLATNSSNEVSIRPFAKVTAQVLKRFGGKYVQLAEKLEQSSLLSEALAAARAIQEESSRAEALTALVDKLPEVLPEALAAAKQIQDEEHRATALSALADKLPPELLPEALAAARQIQDEEHRATAHKKILILTANPKNTSWVDLDKEVREIKSHLRRARNGEQFEIITQLGVRVKDLQRTLFDHKPQIVHFTGHGAGDDGLVFENDQGLAQLVSTQALASLFRLYEDQIECVFLNTNYSEVQAEAIYQHIDYVIGMSQAIGDRAAIQFAVGFYDAIGEGRSYEEAFKFGCNAIELAGFPEYFSVPVLKSRQNALNSSSALLDAQAAAKQIQDEQHRATAHKTILILTANPKGTTQLRLDEEVREIENRLKRARNPEQFEIITQLGVTVEDLRRALFDHKPQIVHFAGHGAGDEGLVFENDEGEMQLVSTQVLASLFRLYEDQIECVLLNAEYSEVQAEVIHQHIDYVIGISKAISDNAAIEFAVGFYDAIAAGSSYEEAFEFGCNAIELAGIPEFSVPVLKSRQNALNSSFALLDAQAAAKQIQDEEHRATAHKKILILTANPKNTSRLQLYEEVREIENRLKRARNPEQFEIITQLRVRVEDLQRALFDYKPQIVHYAGIGSESDGLVFENDEGEAQFVSTQDLVSLFRLYEDQIECVFLNTDYSELEAEAIHQHIDYVIGMSQPIGDRAAIQFAVGFYDAIAAGSSYELAFEFGCNAIELAGFPEFSTPVLKSRKNALNSRSALLDAQAAAKQIQDEQHRVTAHKKILILTANPKGTTRLPLYKEVREIKNRLKRARNPEQFEIITQLGVRVKDLQRALFDHKPQIVHFAGHGAGDEGLVFENDQGLAQLVSTQALASLFRLYEDQIECVLLNADYSEVQAEAIYQHIDYVIGMSQTVSDNAAIGFAVEFYDAIGAGRSYEEAFKFGCIAFELEGIPVPVLKSRKNSLNSPSEG